MLILIKVWRKLRVSLLLRKWKNRHAHWGHLCLLCAVTVFIMIYSIIQYSINIFCNHMTEKKISKEPSNLFLHFLQRFIWATILNTQLFSLYLRKYVRNVHTHTHTHNVCVCAFFKTYYLKSTPVFSDWL